MQYMYIELIKFLNVFLDMSLCLLCFTCIFALSNTHKALKTQINKESAMYILLHLFHIFCMLDVYRNDKK